jgi:hypothetical protein
MKSTLAVLLLLVLSVVVFSLRHHTPPAAVADSAPVPEVKTINHDRNVQMEATKKLRDSFLSSGIDAEVRFIDSVTCAEEWKKMNAQARKLGLPQHKDNCKETDTQVTIVYPLASAVLAYKLAHDESFLPSLHRLGFTQVVLTDGHSTHWVWYDGGDDFSPEWKEDRYSLSR